MGMTLLAGRDFTERDDLSAPRIAIVNEQFAKTFYGGGNPIGGKSFRVPQEAGHTRRGLPGGRPGPETPSTTSSAREAGPDRLPSRRPRSPTPAHSVTFMVRISGAPRTALDGIMAAAAAVNPNVIVQFSRASSSLVRDSLTRDRLDGGARRLVRRASPACSRPSASTA